MDQHGTHAVHLLSGTENRIIEKINPIFSLPLFASLNGLVRQHNIGTLSKLRRNPVPVDGSFFQYLKGFSKSQMVSRTSSINGGPLVFLVPPKKWFFFHQAALVSV